MKPFTYSQTRAFRFAYHVLDAIHLCSWIWDVVHRLIEVLHHHLV
ncbi:hypothetical protein [Luteibacter sp. ME-Dv--P-043b]|nr:hypothetical protein [Luteibacter sp. ME-Dv--P-043b]